MTNEHYEQLELPLEYSTYDHYTVTIRKGDDTGSLQVIRSQDASDADGAINLIEGLRELWGNRDSVTWQRDEVDMYGTLFGLAPGGTVYEITVVPPLSTELTK